MKETVLICATVLALVGTVAGCTVWQSRIRADAEVAKVEARKNAPKGQTPHERNLDKYLERFDRLVPKREEKP